ncbi:hypothetical protein [Aquimarina litoralis]|uniref:hypothetical protein n=1 Tax=Aquimarina litoralis TaxID=584605 RepID=UPI001C59A7A5|nr:hypothetical protein [Aquimarina litoralis]MBW1296068.1 hypothetical protein [Aquimarina litoralis]
MLNKLHILFFLCVASMTFSQQSSLTMDDFIGDWSMEKSNEHFPDIYLNKLESKKGYNGYGVSFFIGEYTGKRRLQPFKISLPKRRCGNDNRRYFSNDFRNQDIWKYDPNTQLLIVIDYKNSREKKFKVSKVSPVELILNRVE